MFRLFRVKRKKVRPIPSNRIRLCLETLESRDCPSGSDPATLLIGAPSLSTVPVQTSTTPAAPQAPSITLNLAYGAQRNITLSGQVTDASPGGLTVTFTGSYQGTVVTNADGTFSLSVTATRLGTISASTVDGAGLTSNVATVTVASNAPQITNFSCSVGANNIWTFRGTVVDESAPNLVVTFAGLPSVAGQTVTVEADGTFVFIVQMQPNEDGTVTAQTTDWWGLTSNTVNYIVRQP